MRAPHSCAKNGKGESTMPPTVVCNCPDKLRKRGENPYAIFDLTMLEELKKSVKADDMLNRLSACAHLPIGFTGNDKHDPITYRHTLREWDKSVGLYHIWADDRRFCEIHKTYALECLYVGKGEAFTRIIDDHLNNKLEEFGAYSIYVSFYECENRFAKYYEQLFLDVFKIPLNKSESTGNIELWAYWPTERVQYGTDAHNNADRYAAKAEGIGKNK